jgi:hypothetical protein
MGEVLPDGSIQGYSNRFGKTNIQGNLLETKTNGIKILVGCEESQAVTKEFRRLGFEAYSCDLLPCSGGHPEWHLQLDVKDVIKGGLFKCASGEYVNIKKWDAIISFPTCTFLTNAGTRHFSRKINTEEKVLAREKKRLEAAEFFMLFANSECDNISIENPVGWMNTAFRKPDQIIHPYYFGDDVKKRTCLWLKGFPLLKNTNLLPIPEPLYICQGEKCKGKKIGWVEGIKVNGGQAERAKARSKTFPGIAKAMAEQWGEYLINNLKQTQ